MSTVEPAFVIDGESREIVTIERQAGDAARELVAEAEHLTVVTQQDAGRAADFLGALVERRKAVESWFQPLVDAAHKAHRALTSRRAAVLEEFDRPEQIVRQKLADWKSEADKARKVAEAEAREQARRDAEVLQLARAEAALQRGDDEQAERILDAPPPPVVVPPVTTAAPGKLDGVGFVESWQFEVDDVDALPREYMTPNVAAIRKVVSALKGSTRIPGVRVWSEQQVRAARRG